MVVQIVEPVASVHVVLSQDVQVASDVAPVALL